jgi:hypothetical protein
MKKAEISYFFNRAKTSAVRIVIAIILILIVLLIFFP